MQWLTAVLKGVRTRGWNYEYHLLFAVAILPMAYNFWSSKDICAHIERQMDLWDQGRFAALLYDTVNSIWEGIIGPVQGVSMTVQEECAAQAYNCTLIYGRINQAVQISVIREGGGGDYIR